MPSVPSSPAVFEAGRRTRLERLLKLFADVRPKEGPTSLMLLGGIFLILMAYYFVKPVREGWLSVSMIAGLSKIEVKAYSAFGQSLLLLAVVPFYAWLAARLPRGVLMLRVALFFSGALVLFWLLTPGRLLDQVPYAGVAFYLFVGIFSVTLVAQFWSFAADLYGEERGKRLFPLVALGAASGAAAGSWLGERLLRAELVEAFDLILLALIPLTLAILLVLRVDQRGARGRPGSTDARRAEPAAPGDTSPFELIARHRYLVAAAALMLVFSWVVASGDNILFAAVQEVLEEEHAGAPPEELGRIMKNATTAFYGELYFWVNVIGLLLQAFVVSRLVAFGGFGTLMLAAPAISLVAYSSMLAAPALAVIKAMKVAENASNYSINNTARQMLWLPTTKEMLYKAKPAIDTLIVRCGDGLAALTVLLGTRLFALSVLEFLVFNLALAFVWFAIAVYIAREHRRLVELQSAGTERPAVV